MMEYGLLGSRLGHSWSKPIHNMLADYAYELYAVTPEELQKIMTERAFKGLNVTIPYKRDVMPYCDFISDEAQSVGSVNTLVMGVDGKLRGYNTDLFGFLSMAHRKGICLTGKKVAILGTGGTSLTAQAACRAENAAQVVVVSRSGPVDYDTLHREHADAQIIINTTPVGMYPGNGECAINLADFPNVEGVIDVIYNPLRTRLLQDAKARGIPHADGLWMLVAQAKKAAEHFTGHAIDDAEIARVHASLRADMANIVLIGMPGCGKTTIGRKLAGMTGRTYVDLDEAIAQQAGMSVPNIFATQGEAAFRSMEHAACEQYGKEKSLIIATGGGVIKRQDNMDALSQNGCVIWLKRPSHMLPTTGRPLSRDRDTVRQLEKERTPLYTRYADAQVDNTSSPDNTAKRVMEAFYEAVDR